MLTLNKQSERGNRMLGVFLRTTVFLLCEFLVLGLVYWLFVVQADLGPRARAFCDVIMTVGVVVAIFYAILYAREAPVSDKDDASRSNVVFKRVLLLVCLLVFLAPFAIHELAAWRQDKKIAAAMEAGLESALRETNPVRRYNMLWATHRKLGMYDNRFDSDRVYGYFYKGTTGQIGAKIERESELVYDAAVTYAMNQVGNSRDVEVLSFLADQYSTGSSTIMRNAQMAIELYERAYAMGDVKSAGEIMKLFEGQKDFLNAYLWSVRCTICGTHVSLKRPELRQRLTAEQIRLAEAAAGNPEVSTVE